MADMWVSPPSGARLSLRAIVRASFSFGDAAVRAGRRAKPPPTFEYGRLARYTARFHLPESPLGEASVDP